MADAEEEPSSETFPSLLTFVMVAIVIWLLFGIAIVRILPEWSARNAFGGMFGAVNSLFSGLALAGVIYTIFLQQRELRLQRRELKRAATAHEEDFDLSRIRFLTDLDDEFTQHEGRYKRAEEFLHPYDPEVDSLNKQAYNEVVKGLEILREGAIFINKVSNLLEGEIVDRKPLFLMYYDQISSKPDGIIKKIYKWLGTGLDLYANYDARDVLQFANSFEYLLSEMKEEVKDKERKTYDFQLENIREIRNRLEGSLDKYDYASDKYEDNYISMEDPPVAGTG